MDMMIVGILLALFACALFVLGGLAFAKKLPGNNYVGIRVSEVRKSQEIWEAAHHVAGTFWLVGAVALTFGAFTAFIAAGWLWILPILSVVIALVAIGAGANVGARTAATLAVAEEADEQRQAEAPAAPPTAKVNMDALRRAAQQSDSDHPGTTH